MTRDYQTCERVFRGHWLGPLLALFLLLQVSSVLAQWKVGAITVEGNQHFSQEEILKQMTLTKGESYSEWITEEDRMRILAFYRGQGFVQARVDEFQKKVNIDQQQVDILIYIEEGLQTILQKIEFSGNKIFASSDLLGLEDIPLGKPLDGRKLAALKQKILDRYNNHGYLYCETGERFVFPGEGRNAVVYFDIDEGVQVTVGHIEIVGNSRVKTSMIKKGLEIKEGQVYTEQKMQQSTINLYRTGVLQDIRHSLNGLDEKKPAVDVVLKVTEGDFRSTGVGMGVGDVDGLRGFVELGHHNLMGRAYSLLEMTRVTYQVFEKNPAYKYSFSSSLTLRQPYFLNSRIEASTTGLFEKVGYAHHDEEKVGINLLIRNMVTVRRELSLLVELNTRNIFDVDLSEADQSVIDNMGRRVTNLISPLLVFDGRDDRFNPRKGYYMVLKSSLAGGPFLVGSINFYLFSVSGTYIQPLWDLPNPLVLAGRVKLGVVREFGGTPSVPPTEAFNIGGSNSLRGYSELSLGPINDRDIPGNVLVQNNLELRYPIFGNLGGVVFIDAANVFRELHLDERFYLLTTAGLGLRYRTPVGPIRIDGALKLNNLRAAPGTLNKETRSKGRIHFGIGHAF